MNRISCFPIKTSTMIIFLSIGNTGFCTSIMWNNDQNHKNRVINGSANLVNAEYENVTVNGSLSFNNLSVKNKLNVNGTSFGLKLIAKIIEFNGSIEASNVKAQLLTVNGSLTGSDITITEKTKLNGPAHVNNAQLHSVDIASTIAAFIDSEITGNTVIKKVITNDKPAKQIIELKGNTVVLGDITFEQEGGEIHLYDQAEVKGTVLNGRVVKK